MLGEGVEEGAPVHVRLRYTVHLVKTRLFLLVIVASIHLFCIHFVLPSFICVRYSMGNKTELPGGVDAGFHVFVVFVVFVLLLFA